MTERRGDTLLFHTPPVIAAQAAVGGKKESEGPLAAGFDELTTDNRLGQRSWEAAEKQLLLRAARLCLQKASLPAERVDLALAGDLQAQCRCGGGIGGKGQHQHRRPKCAPRLACGQHPQHLGSGTVKPRPAAAHQCKKFLGGKPPYLPLTRRVAYLDHLQFLRSVVLSISIRKTACKPARNSAPYSAKISPARRPRSAPARWALRCTGRQRHPPRWAAY